MGRLLESLRAESETRQAATPATHATNQANSSKKCRNVASVATGHDSSHARLLAILRAENLPDQLLGLDHGDLSGLADNALRTYVRMLAEEAERKAGNVPADETAMALCRHCGPVWVHPAVAAVAPVIDDTPYLLGCPWCHVRGAGKAIPRPPVACGDCRNFVPDSVNPVGGMGSCGVGCNPDRPWPGVTRMCARWKKRTAKDGH